MEYNIFIFRRDLRLIDNKGLIQFTKEFSNVLPIFIFTPEQVTDKNEFKSDNAIQFMIESLKELDQELHKKKSKLHLFTGDNVDIIEEICKEIKVNNIGFNKDYTVYSQKRDKDIKNFCKKKNIEVKEYEDYLLSNIGEFNKANGEPYTVYTPFKNNAKTKKIDKVDLSKVKNLVVKNFKNETDYISYVINKNILVKGGRSEGLNMLNKVKDQKDYNKTRNILSLNTSLLSAYIKFGNISIREVYWKVKKVLGLKNNLIDQLFWREFYFYVVYYFPRVLKGENYNQKYDNIEWNKNNDFFKKWCEGNTGYPVVDAGMRQLNKEGFMHNRARMITANFMNRMLGLDWRLGEKYFANKLTDYDPSVNNGNWQWVASTGVDPKPYFQRLFNPWIQSKKFDIDCEYIKKWIPELKNVKNKHIHQWDKYCFEYELQKINYFEPIVNYKKARAESVKMYRSVL